jgi:hypothetical protein
VLKAVYDHFDSDSSTDEHRRTLHVMYGGSWDITSKRVVKTLRWVVVAATPAPKLAHVLVDGGASLNLVSLANPCV